MRRNIAFSSRPLRFGKSTPCHNPTSLLRRKERAIQRAEAGSLGKKLGETTPLSILDLSKGKYYNMESQIETLDKILETYEDLYQITSVEYRSF